MKYKDLLLKSISADKYYDNTDLRMKNKNAYQLNLIGIFNFITFLLQK